METPGEVMWDFGDVYKSVGAWVQRHSPKDMCHDEGKQKNGMQVPSAAPCPARQQKTQSEGHPPD